MARAVSWQIPLWATSSIWLPAPDFKNTSAASTPRLSTTFPITRSRRGDRSRDWPTTQQTSFIAASLFSLLLISSTWEPSSCRASSRRLRISCLLVRSLLWPLNQRRIRPDTSAMLTTSMNSSTGEAAVRKALGSMIATTASRVAYPEPGPKINPA